MKRILIVGIALAAIVTIVGIILGSRKGTPSATVGAVRHQGSSEDILPAIREIFQKGGGSVACRSAVMQLNTYIDRNPDKKPEPPADPDKFRQTFGLKPDEWAEVSSSSFTLMDAYYIDGCMMIRDAAYSLGVDSQLPLERATAAFNWVVRQIQLRQPAPLAPVQFVLRRGWGTPLDRSLAFLAMLNQLDVPGCLLAYSEGGPGNRTVYWIPAALLDSEIYLFDTRMGIPLPSPDGKGIATLRQIRNQAKPFNHLSFDDKHSYDVTRDQLQRVEVFLNVPLSGLAPRMKLLDFALGGRQKVRAFVDWESLLAKFQSATQGQNLSIKFLGESGEPTAPMRVLRLYLTPAEGGIDRAGLMGQLSSNLVPGFVIPRAILEQQRSGDFGKPLLELFWSPFYEFFMDPRGQSPRELILRGQLDEASIRLTQAPVQLHIREYLLSLFQPLTEPEIQWTRNGMHKLSLETLQDISQGTMENTQEKVWEWCNQAFSAYREFEVAGNEEDREEKRKKAVSIFMAGDGELNNLFLASVGKPLAAEATFQKALCFHERAARSASTAAWKTAGNWWTKYTEDKDFSSGPRNSQARLLRALALRMQPDPAAAIRELEKPDPGLSNLEETARLFQIRQLKKAAP
jgi:hypothetical protein